MVVMVPQLYCAAARIMAEQTRPATCIVAAHSGDFRTKVNGELVNVSAKNYNIS